MIQVNDGTVTPGSSFLVVEADPGFGKDVSYWLREASIKVILVNSANEAIQLIHDCVAIKCSLDGLLVDYYLRETRGCRVLREFQHEYPGAAVAIMTEEEDISVNIWANTRAIRILRKPLDEEDIQLWLRELGLDVPVAV